MCAFATVFWAFFSSRLRSDPFRPVADRLMACNTSSAEICAYQMPSVSASANAIIASR